MAPTTDDLPQLPAGRMVELPGRGTVFVRECDGPPGAPTVVLLHGLALSADLNWFGAFTALSEQYRVVALDLRGHGHSPAGRNRLQPTHFSLAYCADDVAALADVLRLGRFVAVGYSMGGLVAQLLWLRHPERLDGLVLCSTARNFRGSPMERWASLSMPGFAIATRFNPFLHVMGSGAIGSVLLEEVGDPVLRRWAHAEMEHTSLATTSGALEEVSAFTSHGWIGTVAVPTAVVVTGRDQIVPTSRQRRLAAAIPGAVVHEMDDDHGVFVYAARRFGLSLLAACRSVTGDSTLRRTASS